MAVKTSNKRPQDGEQLMSAASAALLGRPVPLQAKKKAKIEESRAKPKKGVSKIRRVVDPAVLREEAEIAYLEKKLGLGGGKGGGGKAKLAREYEDDGFGGDFMDFLAGIGSYQGAEGGESEGGGSDDDGSFDQAAFEAERDEAVADLPTEDEFSEEDEDVPSEKDSGDFHGTGGDDDSAENSSEGQPETGRRVRVAKVCEESFSDEDEDDEDDEEEDNDDSEVKDEDECLSDDYGGEAEEAVGSGAVETHTPKDPHLLREEAEIAYLEKKLGLKKGGNSKKAKVGTFLSVDSKPRRGET